MPGTGNRRSDLFHPGRSRAGDHQRAHEDRVPPGPVGGNLTPGPVAPALLHAVSQAIDARVPQLEAQPFVESVGRFP